MKLDENALVPLGGYESARSWVQMKLQEFARAINRRSIEYEVSASMPTAGAWKKGDFVRNAAPSLSGGVTPGWLRLTDGSAHTAGTDWAAINWAAASATYTFTMPRSSGADATALTLADPVTGAQTAGYGLRLAWSSNAGATAAAIGFEVGGDGTNNQSQIAFYTQASSGSLTRRARFTDVGDCILILKSSAPTLGVNQEMVFTLTSDTNLLISVRGGDGTTRTANITLA